MIQILETITLPVSGIGFDQGVTFNKSFCSRTKRRYPKKGSSNGHQGDDGKAVYRTRLQLRGCAMRRDPAAMHVPPLMVDYYTIKCWD